jgi:DNA-binding transcriptional ArsR family regulator
MSSTYTSAVGPGGDLDIASAAALFAEPSRARILMALDDGRALPASVLAAEARVSAQAASAQLAKLTAAGLIQVERSGRHRYYRLADPDVAAVLEALAHLSPVQPVRSLRQHTRAAALRNARTCYDHLAGRLGVQVTQALVAADALTTTDGVPDTRRRPGDRISSQLQEHPYRLGPTAVDVFSALGVPPEQLAQTGDGTVVGSNRQLLRFCMDWSEQRHHLAGRLGADMLAAFVGAGWIVRQPGHRAVAVSPAGLRELRSILGDQIAG